MILTRDLLRRAHLCIGKMDVRYYLNYVLVEPHPSGGALLVACDGHRMLLIHDKDAADVRPTLLRVDQAILDLDDRDATLALYLTSPPTLEHRTACYAEVRDGAGVPVAAGVAKVLDELPMKVYPKWRDVLPTKLAPVDRLVMNGAYLDEVVQALSTGPHSIILGYAQEGDTQKAYVFVTDPSKGLRAMLLLMPIKDEYQHHDPLAPSWFRDLLPETAGAA